MTLKKFNLVESYICNDCLFIFSLHTPLNKNRKRPFCPKCGEKMEVTPLQHVVKKRPQNRNWTDEELTYIDKIITGELKVYQVAYKLNRTTASIKGRLARRKVNLQK